MTIYNRTERKGRRTETEDGWPRGAGGLLGLWLVLALIAPACLGATVSLRTFATIPNPVCSRVIAADAKPQPSRAHELPHFADMAVLEGISPIITKYQ